MALNWQADSGSKFADTMYAYLKAMEGDTLGPILVPTNSGNPTIGIGFDLVKGGEPVREAVLIGMGFDSTVVHAVLTQAGPLYQPNTWQFAESSYISQLVQKMVPGGSAADMDRIMAARAADPAIISAYPNVILRTSFAFANDDEVRLVYDKLLPIYEQAVFKKFPTLNLKNNPDYLNSRERMVLVDMVWNGGSGLIGKNLQQAILNGNRADAWFEIRYGSNANEDKGLAKRRYLESQLFGLYDDPNQATPQEALQTYQMLTDHRLEIVSYEDKYGVDPDGTSAVSAYLLIHGETPLAAAGDDYRNSSPSVVPAISAAPQTLVDALRAAEKTFIGQLQDQYKNDSEIVSSLNVAAFDGLTANIYLADSDHETLNVTLYQTGNFKDGTTNLLYSDNGDDNLIGGAGSDIIVGGSGTDFLRAGSGNETLIGGSGNETMVGYANGNDTFVYISGTAATNTIEGNDSKGTVYVDGTQLVGPGNSFIVTQSGASVIWTTNGDGTKYQFTPDPDSPSRGIGTMTISQGKLGGQGGQIVIKNFDLGKAATGADGYLGIHIGEQTAFGAESSGSSGASGSSASGSGSDTGGVHTNSVSSGTGGSSGPGNGSPFAVGNYHPDDVTVNTSGELQVFTVYASAKSDKEQTVSLALNGGDASQYKINTGADLLDFSSGTIALTIPAGSDNVTVALVYTGDLTQSQSIQLTSQLLNADGTPLDGGASSNTLSVTFSAQANTNHDNLNPLTGQSVTNASITTSIGQASLTNGKSYQGTAGNDVANAGSENSVILGAGGNDSLIGGTGNDTIVAGDGDNIIAGGGGVDLIYAGNGNNKLYANGVTDDIAAAIDQAQTGQDQFAWGTTLLAGDGNNTLIGGAAWSAFAVGTGNNLIITGPGTSLFIGGIEFGTNSLTAKATPVEWQRTVTGPKVFDWADNMTGVDGYSAGTYPLTSNYEGNKTLNAARDTFVPVGLGNDTIFGGKGNDEFDLSNGDNYVDGGAGNDTILGGMGKSTIFGGAGDDLVVGGGGDEYIDGEDGNNFLMGRGGNNTIYGGTGNDTIYAGYYKDDWATSETGNNYVEAGSGNTVIYGAGGSDTIFGGGGKDTLYAGAGNEYIEAGDGDTLIVGGKGTDTLVGGDGNDTIQAGDGDTTIYGGDGVQTISGGKGKNLIYAGDGGTADQFTQVVVGDGDTTVHGGSGIDHIVGGKGDNILYAGDGGDDTGATVVVAGSGNTTIYGGNGVDQLYGGDGATLIYAGDGGTTASPTQIVVGTGDTTVFGGNGIDSIVGGTGNDMLFAGDGGTADHRTTVVAGSGNSTIVAGAGASLLIGNGPNTTFVLGYGVGDVIVQGGNNTDIQFGSGVSANGLDVSAVQDSDGSAALAIDTADGEHIVVKGGLTGSLQQVSFADGGTLSLNQLLAQANIIASSVETASGTINFGGDDDTTFQGIGSNDTLVGGAGNDTFIVNSTNQVVIEKADQGDDTISSSVSYTLSDNVENLTLTGTGDLAGTGNALDNVITANDGNDTLSGGLGHDTLIGGAGYDTFLMNYSMGQATVIDSSSLGGRIKLGSGMSFDEVSATRQGDDLLLTIDGSDSSMLVQNYYQGTQSWDIVDANGDSMTAQDLVAATTQTQGDRTKQLWASFARQEKLDLINQYLAQGYTMQADGTLDRLDPLPGSPGLIPVVATYDSTTTIRTDDVLGTSTTVDANLYLRDYYNNIVGIYDNQLSVTSSVSQADGSIIYADPSFDSYHTSSTAWMEVTWRQSGSRPYSQTTYSSGGGPIYGNSPDGYSEIVGSHSWTESTTHIIAGYEGTATGFSFTHPAESSTTTIHVSGPGLVFAIAELPSVLQAQYNQNHNSYQVRELQLAPGDHTVYANEQTMVVGGDGNNTIYGAGLAVVNSGDNYIVNADTVYGGSGNDTMIGGGTMVAGTGNEQMFANGQHDTVFEIDPTTSGTDLIGGVGDTEQFANAFYQSRGIDNWQESLEHPDTYEVSGEYWGQRYNTKQEMLAHLAGTGETLQQWLDSGAATYIAPLPVVLAINYASMNLQPSAYYQAAGTPTINLHATDFDALAPYYAQGVLATNTVVFDSGISLSDLHLSWGQVTGSLSGLPTDPPLPYVTLDISWGPGQEIRVMMPHSDDPIGSGVTSFKFADGTQISMKDMLALAPPVSDFDPNYTVVNDDGQGNVDTAVFRANGSLKSDTWTHADGSYGSTTFNTDGSGDGISHYVDGSYDVFHTDGQGNDITTTYDANGTKLSDSWESADGSTGTDTFNAGGSVTGQSTHPDGSYSTTTNDGHGNITTLNFASDDTPIGDVWSKADGSHGSDVYGQDGSSTITVYNADGSHTLQSTDRFGSTLSASYDANGNGSDTWNNINDGTYGDDTFHADGSSEGTVHNSDGTYSTYTDDGNGGSSTTWYNSQGAKTQDNWTQDDGSNGTDTFNADGSSNGQATYADGSTSTYTNDGQGNIETLNFNANGIQTGDEWSSADGTYGSDVFGTDGTTVATVFQTDGSHTVQSDDGHGNTSFASYEADGSGSGTWSHADGSYGSDTFNADGSSEGTGTYPDGSTSTMANDGHGNAITNWYDSQGVKTSDSWTKADGTAGSDTFNADGSSSGMWTGPDGAHGLLSDDGQGNTSSLTYDANNNLTADAFTYADGTGYSDTYTYDQTGMETGDTWKGADGSFGTDTYNADGSGSDTWQDSDGTHGDDTYNADGSSSGTTINPDGSYSTYTDDGQGNWMQLLFNADGVEVGDNWTKSDGTSGSDTFGGTDGGGGTGGVFAFTAGMGSVTLSSNIDKIQMPSQAEPYEVSVFRDGTNLVIYRKADADHQEPDLVMVPNWYQNPNALPNLTVDFADGTEWNSASLTTQGLYAHNILSDLGRLQSVGATVVTGLAGFPNVLEGWDDTLVGGSGNDTFLYNVGDGMNVIDAHGTNNTLQFGAGITPDMVTLNAQEGALWLRVDSSGDGVNIDGFDPTNALNSGTVQYFRFADGTVLTYAQLLAKGYAPGGGTVTDTYASDGSRTSVFDDGYGDVKTAQYNAQDIKTSESWSYADGSSKRVTYQSDGGRTEIDGDGQGDTSSYTYDANGNLVVLAQTFADGSSSGGTYTYDATGRETGDAWHDPDGSFGTDTYNLDGSSSDTWQDADGTHGTDVNNVDGSGSGTQINPDGSYSTYTFDGQGNWMQLLFNADGIEIGDNWTKSDGTSGSDTFNVTPTPVVTGVAGNHTLTGGAAGETYTFNAGDGTTYMVAMGDGNTLQFGTGITPDMISLGLGSLMLRVGTNGDVVHIEGFDPSNAQGTGAIQNFAFADGTTLTYDQLLQKGFDIYGTTGDETLAGTNLDNRIYAGTGNDLLIGTGANDTLYGGIGNDTLQGGSGNELLIAGEGLTTLIGGTGNNTFVVNNVQDVVQAQAGAANTVQTSVSYVAGANVQNLTGTGSSNIKLTGNNDGDVITSNTAIDTLVGGSGNDTYIVNNAADVITEKSSGGIDTVQSSVSYALSANVENLTLTGSADLSGTGNGLSNVITGNAGNDSLTGGGGNDTLVSGSGIDTLVGGGGNDTYIVNNSADVVTEQAAQGNDTIQSSVSYILADNVETLMLTGSDNLTATGNDGNSILIGNDGNDSLIAGSGNATLISGAGVDTLVGGMGKNTYIVNNSADVITAQATALSNLVQASVNYVLPDNLTTLTLTGEDDLVATGNSLNDIITGNDGNDTLIAGSGNATLIAGTGTATLIGGMGTNVFKINDEEDVVIAQAGAVKNAVQSSVDYVMSDNVTALTLTGSADLTATGNALNDVIIGNAGNDTLIAGSGNATLAGGSGIATLIGGMGINVFKVNNVADVVVAQAGAVKNTVQASVDYAVSDNVGYLTLTGSNDLTATGNATGAVITGNAGNDTLIAGSGGDTLVAGSGLATMIGGSGDDTFKVNNAADVIIAQPGSGNDTVLTSVSYALPANVQNLTGTGSADLTLTGSDFDNVITGNAGNDTLIAGNGNATLVGGSGIDTMIGGTGANVFKVNKAADVVIAQANAVLNTIQSSVSYTASANVTDLILTGTGSITATGNDLNDLLVANSGRSNLVGGTGTDILEGGANNNTLTDLNGLGTLLGNGGNDILNVSGHNDFLAGGTGNDTLTLGGTASIVAFNGGDGQDVINAGPGAATLSLGGGIDLGALSFSKSGNNLILSTGGTDTITLKGWYASSANHDVATLQVIEQASTTYNSSSTDPLYNSKIEEFDFGKLVSAFDQARAANSNLTSWSLLNGLVNAHLASSDTAALGGDLAYQYGMNGNLAGMDVTAAMGAQQDPQFNKTAQAIHPWASISQTNHKLY